MLLYTHLAFAFLVGLYFIPNQIIFVLLGSVIPDIDNTHSWVNRRLKITRIFSYLFKHRGFCHSLWFGLGLFILLSYFIPTYAGAILIGYCSHLVMDSFTKHGVNYLYPISRFHVRGFIETGMGGEKLVLIGTVFLIFLRYSYMVG